MRTVHRVEKMPTGLDTGPSRQILGSKSKVRIIKITGTHPDTPATGAHVYTGTLYGGGCLNGSTASDITIIVAGLVVRVDNPSYGSWSDTPPMIAYQTVYTWTGAATTHTNDIVYEAYPGQLLL